jgi:RHS repeat-associated protein
MPVFTFDIENRRIGKSVNGTQTWYGYDGQNSYADFNGSGSLTMRYLTGAALDSLYARFDGTNTGWYLDAMLGSVRQVANTSGTVLDALTYDSYGQILTESNASNGDRFKYTGREWDSEIGQYSYRARHYNPFDGRFTKQDPIGFRAGDSNLFRYVKNEPTTATDPQGQFRILSKLLEIIGIGVGIAGAVSTAPIWGTCALIIGIGSAIVFVVDVAADAINFGNAINNGPPADGGPGYNGGGSGHIPAVGDSAPSARPHILREADPVIEDLADIPHKIHRHPSR